MSHTSPISTMCLFMTLSISSFLWMPSLGETYQFNNRVFAESDFPLQVALVGEVPNTVTQKEVGLAIQHAISQWNGVTCSFAQLSYMGHVASSEDVDANVVTISFVTPGLDPCFPKDSTLLGITAGICAQNQDVVIVLNNRDYRWQMSPYELQALLPSRTQYDQLVVDLPSTLTHELGHVLGLAHPDVGLNKLEGRLATMSKSYKLDGGQASLAADDRFGLCALYPVEARNKTCVDDTDCENQLKVTGAQCLEQDGVFVCEEPQGQLGDYCSVALLHCPFECYLSSPGAGTGYCTIACDEDTDPCPDGFQCQTNQDDRKFCLESADVMTAPTAGCQHAQGGSGAGVALLIFGCCFAWRKKRRAMLARRAKSDGLI